MKTAHKTEAATSVSGCEEDAESLLDTVLRAPPPRSHQLRLLAAKPSRHQRPLPKRRTTTLRPDRSPSLIKVCRLQRPGAAVREVAE
jgi:hypothetical protein